MKIKKNIAVSDTGFVFNPSSGESFNVNPLGMELLTYLKEDKDYEFIKRIYEELYPKNPLFSLYNILHLLEKKPSIMKINEK